LKPRAAQRPKGRSSTDRRISSVRAAREAIDIGAKVLWAQLGICNDQAAPLAGTAGLKVVMNRCPKIELFRPFWKPRLNQRAHALSAVRRPRLTLRGVGALRPVPGRYRARVHDHHPRIYRAGRGRPAGRHRAHGYALREGPWRLGVRRNLRTYGFTERALPRLVAETGFTALLSVWRTSARSRCISASRRSAVPRSVREQHRLQPR
jgi:hypothetical protein